MYRLKSTNSLSNIENINIRIEIKKKRKNLKRLKTSGRNELQPTLILPFYDHEEAICPARTLQYYLRNKDKQKLY
nr:unnamed protein product [Callosobruchus chinensis]